jgi:heme/copper-type cytochrome/quinol oxidase subunit 4
MNDSKEIVLHWAAALSVLVLGLLALFPEAARRTPIIGAPWNYVFGAALGVTLTGFHFWMIIECVRGGRWTLRRVLWLIFLFLLPVASAVIYFLFTRSKSFDSGLSARDRSQ